MKQARAFALKLLTTAMVAGFATTAMAAKTLVYCFLPRALL